MPPTAELKDEETATRAKLMEKRKGLDEAVLAGNKCPICDGPLGDKHDHILSNIARLVGGTPDAY